MKIVPDEKRYVLIDDSNQAWGEVTYSVAGESIWILDHTFVDESQRGKGYAEELVARVVTEARNQGKKIVPLCPFAQKEFAEKPEYYDVLKKH